MVGPVSQTQVVFLIRQIKITENDSSLPIFSYSAKSARDHVCAPRGRSEIVPNPVVALAEALLLWGDGVRGVLGMDAEGVRHQHGHRRTKIHRNGVLRNHSNDTNASGTPPGALFHGLPPLFFFLKTHLSTNP